MVTCYQANSNLLMDIYMMVVLCIINFLGKEHYDFQVAKWYLVIGMLKKLLEMEKLNIQTDKFTMDKFNILRKMDSGIYSLMM